MSERSRANRNAPTASSLDLPLAGELIGRNFAGWTDELVEACSTTSGQPSRLAAAFSTRTTERLAQWSTKQAKRVISDSRAASFYSMTSKTWVKPISYSRLSNISTARTHPCRSSLD